MSEREVRDLIHLLNKADKICKNKAGNASKFGNEASARYYVKRSKQFARIKSILQKDALFLS